MFDMCLNTLYEYVVRSFGISEKSNSCISDLKENVTALEIL
jgi:hypothetical protein